MGALDEDSLGCTVDFPFIPVHHYCVPDTEAQRQLPLLTAVAMAFADTQLALLL